MKLHASFASQHWGGIFSARNVDIPNGCAEAMLALVHHAPPDLRWNICLDEFEEILASKRESAPRPDGVCLVACTTPLAALGPDFSLLLTGLAYRELSLLALAPEPCSSPSLLSSPEALRKLNARSK